MTIRPPIRATYHCLGREPPHTPRLITAPPLPCPHGAAPPRGHDTTPWAQCQLRRTASYCLRATVLARLTDCVRPVSTLQRALCFRIERTPQPMPNHQPTSTYCPRSTPRAAATTKRRSGSLRSPSTTPPHRPLLAVTPKHRPGSLQSPSTTPPHRRHPTAVLDCGWMSIPPHDRAAATHKRDDHLRHDTPATCVRSGHSSRPRSPHYSLSSNRGRAKNVDGHKLPGRSTVKGDRFGSCSAAVTRFSISADRRM